MTHNGYSIQVEPVPGLMSEGYIATATKRGEIPVTVTVFPGGGERLTSDQLKAKALSKLLERLNE